MNHQPDILKGFQLSDAQRSAALAQGGDVAVTAGAGTGKTRTLVARYLALLAGGLPLRRIIAVTFTRKAAREMRNRIRKEIGDYLSRPGLSSQEVQNWSRFYNELDAARINTIHNICAEILRTHPAEAVIDPRFTILDETQSSLLLLEAVETTLAWAVEQEGMEALFALLREGQLMELIATLINHRFIAQRVFSEIDVRSVLDHWQIQLEENQQAAIEALLDDPAFKAAWQTLRQNAAHYSEDKADEQRRLALDAINILEAETHIDKLRSLALLNELNLRGGSQKNWPEGKEQLKDVKDALKVLRQGYKDQVILQQTINPQDMAIAEAMPAIQKVFEYATGVYKRLKEDRDGLDFDDLEALAIQILEKHPSVRIYWQGQVQALLVDEFQDTNESQRHFLRLLCPKPGRVFIVGDAKQSIYRFRGADVTVFDNEKNFIAAQNGALVDLDTSYRAHESLLKGMNCLLEPVLGLDYPQRPPWAAPFDPLKAGGKAAAAGLDTPFIEFHLTLGSKVEALPRAANALTARLSQLYELHGIDYGQMAILCRTSTAFQAYENAFDAAGIPYLTVAGKGFYNRPEIRDLLNALTAIADPHDDLALTGLLRSPGCALSDVSLYQMSLTRLEGRSLWDSLKQGIRLNDERETQRLQTAIVLIQDLNQQSGRIPVAELLKRFLDRTQYRAGLQKAGQSRALRNVAKLLQDVHLSELVNVDDFLEYQNTLRDSGSREGEARATTGGAVQIMTIHAAKGLEFPVVVLGDAGYQSSSRSPINIDPQLGVLLPYKNENQERATSYTLGSSLSAQKDEAETNRLLYVALTRAEQMLLLSGCVPQSQTGRLSWRGWLKQMAEISGMNDVDLNAYEEGGRGKLVFDYRLEDTDIQATFYEPNYPVHIQADLESKMEILDKPQMRQTLQQPLEEPSSFVIDDQENGGRVWQVVPDKKSRRAPVKQIDTLVHQALSQWRFPGFGFDTWVRARAREYGLIDRGRLDEAYREVVRLLDRFRQSSLYDRIEAAEKRWHNLPFTSSSGDSGTIDLLFQNGNDWTVVEFKTDEITDGTGIQKLLVEMDYEQQIKKYGSAVSQMLNISPVLIVCFLNANHDLYTVRP